MGKIRSGVWFRKRQVLFSEQGNAGRGLLPGLRRFGGVAAVGTLWGSLGAPAREGTAVPRPSGPRWPGGFCPPGWELRPSAEAWGLLGRRGASLGLLHRRGRQLRENESGNLGTRTSP